MEEMNPADRVSNLHDDQKENVMISREKEICNEDDTGTAQMSQIKGNKSSTIFSGMCCPHQLFRTAGI